MTHSIIRSSFAAGEIAPSLWGAVDYAKYGAGCSVVRNAFPSYRMGGSSRAGTKFCGQCLAPGTGLPPRPIRFQVSVAVSYILEFGDNTLRIVTRGEYITEAAKSVVSASNGNPSILNVPAHGYANGDWLAPETFGGMVELNNRTVVVGLATTDTFALYDTFGNPINALAFGVYTGGGTVERILTVASPYAIEDLPYLKFEQAVDLVTAEVIMSLTCVQPTTGVEYLTYDLVPLAADNWVFRVSDFSAAIDPPSAASAVASNPAAMNPTQYEYVATAVDAATGEESVASPVATVSDSVNIATTAGSITVTYDPVDGAGSYRIYKAPAGVFDGVIPIGSSFGYAGSSRGAQWIDQNVVADFTRSPPQHFNPFGRGRIFDATPGAVGAGYTQNTTSVTINTATGTGGLILPVVVAGEVVAYIVDREGEGYAPTNTMTVVGGGAGATGTLTIGPQSGTYPGVVSYFQQRSVYAASLNLPDIYNMSRPGAYKNFDSSDPPVDPDALSGNPWSQQVNGIQWLLPMTGGLLALTGLGIWRISGSNGIAITPSSQDAEPQEYNGIAATVPPIRIKQDVLYVQDKGSLINYLEFNFYNNTFTGADISFHANHLFEGYRVLQWAFAQEPWKIMWIVRDDGRALSLTYVKEQKLNGYGRHDTNGLFVGVAVASESPVDAPYFVVKRYVPAQAQWAYYMERMDNRIWPNAEVVWAVDSGLSLPLATPDATLQAATAEGDGVAFTADAAVFDGVTVGVVGQIIRTGGGKATVTAYVSPTRVLADITMALATMPNDPNELPIPSPTGDWSIATPQTTVRGLDHLEGFLVTGLADGAVITPRLVAGGAITLDRAATAVVVGLGYTSQIQVLPLEVPGGESVQGDRKRIYSVKYRIERSRGIKVGTDQPIASAMENQIEPQWGTGNQLVGRMIETKPRQGQLPAGSYMPLFTGDLNENVDSDFDVPGAVAFQQDYPLPMNILMEVAEVVIGDTNG